MMRHILVVTLIAGPSLADGGIESSTTLGSNAPSSGGGFNTNDGGIVWDNGVFNGVNGIRPTAEWDPSGIIDNFELNVGDSAFSDFHVEMVDGTFPLGVPDTTHQNMRLQVFDLPPGGMPSLVHPDDPGGDVPIFDRTYTRADGTMTVSDTGIDGFDRDVLNIDGTGAPEDLGGGEYVMFVTFPGSGPIDSYLGYSDHPFIDGSTNARPFGPGVNGAVNNQSDAAWNLSIPEPASLALLGFGALAMIRRR